MTIAVAVPPSEVPSSSTVTTSSTTAMEIDNRYANNNNNSNDKIVKADASAAAEKLDELFSPELLQMYYSRLFPYSFLYDWLSYGGSNSGLFARREFSFTIEPTPGEEIYLRYQSFSSEQELSQGILKRRPVKIDIGAVFSHPPKDQNSIQKKKNQPTQRELVFDIDLTDYDQVRHCGCSGANICHVCWGFMKMAVKVMDEGLRQDFGFQNIAWFYSGRRGVHAWVCDETARELTDGGRSAVAHYFDIDLGNDKNKDVSITYPLHPMLSRAYKVLEPLFVEQVVPESGHGLLADETRCTELLDTLPDAAAAVREEIQKQWSKMDRSPEEKWEDIKTHIRGFIKATSKTGSGKASKSMTTKDRQRIENWPVEVVFRHTYPRLDVNVSKTRNHLLKSPFCVHPKTGRVCVPFQASEIDTFDPFTVPTLPQLMSELNEYDSQHDENADESSSKRTIPNWQKTSLKQYFEPFQTNFLQPLVKEMRRKEKDQVEKLAAVKGEF